MTYEKNKNNNRENLENYEAILILVVKDDFYNFESVANMLQGDLYFLNIWYLSYEVNLKMSQSVSKK